MVVEPDEQRPWLSSSNRLRLRRNISAAFWHVVDEGSSQILPHSLPESVHGSSIFSIHEHELPEHENSGVVSTVCDEPGFILNSVDPIDNWTSQSHGLRLRGSRNKSTNE